MNLKAKIEAVLFLTAKPVRAQALARIVNADVQAVRQCVLELVHDYEERQGGLEISDEDGYSFQVKEEYASLMDEFLPVEMSAALIRTLSAIAIKQPISQSDIIRVRGAGAYDHIRELINRDLVSKREEQGERSPTLATTKKFQEYFRLTKEGKDLRTFLKREVRKANAAETAAVGVGEPAGQLVIPNVVSPETDSQLNSGIFLETADYIDASESADQHANQDTLEGEHGAHSAAGVDNTATAVTASADNAFAQPLSQSEEDQSVSPAIDEISSISSDLQPTPMVDSELVASIESNKFSDADPSTKVVARKTLSKLEKAARSKEPKAADMSDATPAAEPSIGFAKDDSSDKAVKEGRSSASGAAKVQARGTVKNEPRLRTGGKNRKETPGKLEELMKRQSQFEKQLKLGLFHGDEGEMILDFEAPPAPPSQIQKKAV